MDIKAAINFAKSGDRFNAIQCVVPDDPDSDFIGKANYYNLIAWQHRPTDYFCRPFHQFVLDAISKGEITDAEAKEFLALMGTEKSPHSEAVDYTVFNSLIDELARGYTKRCTENT